MSFDLVYYSQIPFGGESSREASNGPDLHLVGNASKQLPKTDKSVQKLKSISSATQLGIRRSDRQQKQMLAKTLTSTVTTNSNAFDALLDEKGCTSFNERFRLLPQFDHDNYKSPTQWPAFGEQRPQIKKRLLAASSDMPEPPTKKFIRNASSASNFNETIQQFRNGK